jgi:ABC-type histidine transport system ATPase subunit
MKGAHSVRVDSVRKSFGETAVLSGVSLEAEAARSRQSWVLPGWQDDLLR